MQWIVDERGSMHLHLKVILAVAYGLTLAPMLEIGFTMQDDALLALAAESRSLHSSPFLYLIQSAFEESQYYGRVWVTYGTLMSYVPFLVHSLVYYKLVAFASLTLNVVLFAWMVQRVFRSQHFALLASVLLLAFLQNSAHYNLITSFVAHFMVGLSALFLSLILFDDYLASGKRWQHVFAGICIFIAFFTYEMFVLYYVLFPILVVRNIMERNQLSSPLQALAYWKQGMRNLLPTMSILIFYLAVYVGYRFAFPTKYSGIEIEFSPSLYIHTVHKLTIGGLPISLYIRHSYDSLFDFMSQSMIGHRSNLAYVLSVSRPEWLARAALLSFAGLVVLRDKPQSMTGRMLAWLLVCCVGLFWLPGLLPALTSRYQIFVQMGLPMYLVTSFSYYAFTVAFAAAVLFANARLHAPFARRWLHAILVATVFCWSILTDYTNYHVALSQSQVFKKWLIVDDFLKTPDFESIPEGSFVYAPTLWQHSELAPLVEVPHYWERYIHANTLKKITVIKKESEFKKLLLAGAIQKDRLYYLKFSQARKSPDQFLVFARLNEAGVRGDRPYFRTDAARLFTRSAYRKFTVYVPAEAGPGRIQLDGRDLQPSGGFISAVVDKESMRSKLIPTDLRAASLDPEGITISNYVELTDFPFNEKPSMESELDDEARKRLLEEKH